MPRYVWDIESNGLLADVTRMWIMTLYDRDTGKYYEYLEGDFGWKEKFNSAKVLIGHNIINYDLCVLEKLFGYKLPKHVKVQDTLLMSQILDYRRFRMDGHSLEAWGESLGIPKVQHEDWSQFSPEMRVRNVGDVKLNNKVYEILSEEFKAAVAKNPLIKTYIQAEHAAAKWCATAQIQGWTFDLEKAKALYDVLQAKLDEAHAKLSARLGTKTVPKDKEKGEIVVKKPKWLKNGFYDAHTCNWFGVDAPSGYPGEERMIEGPYCRLEFVPLSLGSVDDVKTFLYRHGWEPTEWNYKKDPTSNKKTPTSPKITEDSLELLGGDGALYTEFVTASSRFSILKTWIKNTDADGNLHGDCMLIGTPSMRARHSIIVNVPSGDAKWGREMRDLFTCPPGWTLIGCDSSGNQARGLAHYLGDPEFIDTLLNGDIHTYNANIIDSILKSLKIDWSKYLISQGAKSDDKHTLEENLALKKRGAAKRILYAFLFGASGGKLWSYIFGKQDKIKGNKFKTAFIKAVPGFAKLIEKLENIFFSTSKRGLGYIPSLVGCKIYVDSAHKLLVYLLQATEKITCSTALMFAAEKMAEEGIPYRPCIFYHDEIDFMVPTEFAQRAAEIGKDAFKEGPKLYGIEIMDGGAKIGKTWYDVH